MSTETVAEVTYATAAFNKLAANFGRLRSEIESKWIGGAPHGVTFSSATHDNDLLITAFGRLLRGRFEAFFASPENRKLMGSVKFSIPVTETNGATGFEDVYVIYFDVLGNAYLNENLTDSYTTVENGEFALELGFKLASHLLKSRFLIHAGSR